MQTASFSGLQGGATAVTLETGEPGPSGEIVGSPLTLTDPGSTSGTFSGSETFNFGDFQAITSGIMYVNVESSAYPNGEIAGALQLGVLPEPTSLGILSVGALALLRRNRLAAPLAGPFRRRT